MKMNNNLRNELGLVVLCESEQKEVIGGFMPPFPSPYLPSPSDLQDMLDRLREMNEKKHWLETQRNMMH